MDKDEKKIWKKFGNYYLKNNKLFTNFRTVEINQTNKFTLNNIAYNTNYKRNSTLSNQDIINYLFKSVYKYIYQLEEHEQNYPQSLKPQQIISDVQRSYRQKVDLKLLDNFKNNYHTLDNNQKTVYNSELKKMTGSIGEHFLFNLFLEKYNAIPLFLRVKIKSSPNDEVKDVDALHYDYNEDKFLVGESKIILPTSETVLLSDVVRNAIKDSLEKLEYDTTVPLIRSSSLFLNDKKISRRLSEKYEKIQTEEDKFCETANIVILVGISKNMCAEEEISKYIDDQINTIQANTIESYFKKLSFTSSTNKLCNKIHICVYWVEDLLDLMLSIYKELEEYDGSIKKISNI